MSPTVIGGGSGEVATKVVATSLEPLVTGQIVLTEGEKQEVAELLEQIDFSTIKSAEIITLGLETEKSLHQTLDGFLVRLDKETAAPVFALFDRLQKGVADAKLPDLLTKIQQTKPGLVTRIVGSLKRKSASQIAQETYGEVRSLIADRTKSLCDEMKALETDLTTQVRKLLGELAELDRLKIAYGDQLGDFKVAAAMSQAFLVKAREHVADRVALVGENPDALAQAELQELQAKLQLLESRALTLEGAYTRLPADRLVIQQIEQAGVTTLQEVATTGSSRFASIKMTLLSLHGAIQVKGLQQLSARQADLDRQLTAVRGSITKEVATSAATAPGDNRLAQAAQIEQIIRETEEVNAIVAKAREENEKKFAEARTQFALARQRLASLK